MSRRFWNDGQEIVREDLNAISSAMERHFYERVIFEMMNRRDDSFFNDSLQVQFSSSNSVLIRKGLGFMVDSTQTSPEPKKRPLVLAADTVFGVNSPDPTNPRIDIVVVKHQLVNELTGSRKVKDAGSGVITNESLTVQKDWAADIVVVAGTPAGSPVAPATPAGYKRIASVLVAAVTGIAGGGSITDERTLMPVGGDQYFNTTGFTRLPAGSETKMSAILSTLDGLLKNGYFEYFDLQELGGIPANPSAGRQRIYLLGDVIYRRTSSGTSVPVGSGGGGGGGLEWLGPIGFAPNVDEDFQFKAHQFEKDEDQLLTTYVKVPDSYIAGRQISLIFEAFSESSADGWLFEATTTLIRKNLDAIDSVTNQHVANSGTLTNTVAKQVRQVTIAMTTSGGAINSIAVNPGDLLKVQLRRETPTGNDDTAFVRFIPTSTEVKVG